MIDDLLLTCNIGLVHNHNGLREVEAISDPLITRTKWHRRVEDQASHINVTNTFNRCSIDSLTQGTHRLV